MGAVPPPSQDNGSTSTNPIMESTQTPPVMQQQAPASSPAMTQPQSQSIPVSVPMMATPMTPQQEGMAQGQVMGGVTEQQTPSTAPGGQAPPQQEGEPKNGGEYPSSESKGEGESPSVEEKKEDNNKDEEEKRRRPFAESEGQVTTVYTVLADVAQIWNVFEQHKVTSTERFFAEVSATKRYGIGKMLKKNATYKLEGNLDQVVGAITLLDKEADVVEIKSITRQKYEESILPNREDAVMTTSNNTAEARVAELEKQLRIKEYHEQVSKLSLVSGEPTDMATRLYELEIKVSPAAATEQLRSWYSEQARGEELHSAEVILSGRNVSEEVQNFDEAVSKYMEDHPEASRKEVFLQVSKARPELREATRPD